MMGELLFKRRRRSLLFATFIQHDTATACAAWAGVEPHYAPLVRHILAQLSRRTQSAVDPLSPP
jgi:hypothetical protein